MIYSHKNIESFTSIEKVLPTLCQEFENVAFLGSMGYYDKLGSYKNILSCSNTKQITDLNSLKKAQNTQNWLFGFLGYDLKNHFEKLSSTNFDGLKFPELCLFEPENLWVENNNNTTDQLIGDYKLKESNYIRSVNQSFKLKARTTKNSYLKQVGNLQEHIRKGDIYEVNYCHEFYDDNATIDPVSLFISLIKQTNSPFTSFFKFGDYYILSLSPERFLSKKGQRMCSQPMKGTSKRSSDPSLDEQLKKDLKESKKERAENIMITDLVRNDLMKCCEKGTVTVDELCAVYTFPKVHQMISTISGTLLSSTKPIDAVLSTFPMGSMTGAPKIKAMELIEKYEDFKRGAFSGSAGYFNPNGDFDLNVLIRTFSYNAKNNYLSYSAGSAITYDSDPEAEYEESILKVNNLWDGKIV
ncbi:MAG: para-aminobenzoate synthetase component 1 [Sphingobacteriales bacterium]